ncbi:ABC transporter ATP-binding protein [Streptomyces sulphureus]|uniref:ABC transporter ATP-binding protein n=1 Tax=Streptomyces sulphureus TaxID=47758 RepID=UPI0003751752|nr:ABC transporter ATP-binding protein [Streptomyces sulphureus]
MHLDDVQTTADPSSGPTAKISARGIGRSFGTGPGAVHALGPLDLDIGEGEFVSLVGPSGCGKSTFVRLVAGLLPPTFGEMTVRIEGDPPAPIATVFQGFGIFPWKTVLGNVKFALAAAGVERRDANERAMRWLARLGLADFADAYPETLSGGMRQRVAIARALATEPQILLMDEPFAAIDAQMREMLQEELLTISQTERRTVVFVTHSLEEALVLADRVVVMTARPGTLLSETRVPFGRPRDTRVREGPEFGRLRVDLWTHLRDEVQAQMAGQRGGTAQATL